jgi:predicted DNA-binding antitoxin AbrB/MazE fold protein
MIALEGYFNGKEFVPLKKVDVKPNQKVIITVLDEYIESKEGSEKPFLKYFGRLDNDSYKEIEEALKECEKVDASEC